MSDDGHKVAGYCFEDAHAYKEAKREAETVEYIRANTDLNDMKKVLKLYYKLVERGTLKTVIGYQFLVELRNRILQGGIVTEDTLPSIRIDKDEKQIRAYSSEIDHDAEKRHLEMIEDYKNKLKNSMIINVFLVVIIIAMLLISIFSNRNAFTSFENQIIDKYSVWEEELDAREEELDVLEKKLQERENTTDYMD